MQNKYFTVLLHSGNECRNLISLGLSSGYLTRAPTLNWILKTNACVLSHHFLPPFSFSKLVYEVPELLSKGIDCSRRQTGFQQMITPGKHFPQWIIALIWKKNLPNSLFKRSNEWFSSRMRPGYTSYLNSSTLAIISDSLYRICLVFNPGKHICAQAMLITLFF